MSWCNWVGINCAETNANMPLNRLLICATCSVGPDGLSADEFADRIKLALLGARLETVFSVDQVACMGACCDPTPLAIQGAGKATYLFAGLDPKTDAGDIIATCRTYLDAPSGWIEDARTCGRLRHCLRARVPALMEYCP